MVSAAVLVLVLGVPTCNRMLLRLFNIKLRAVWCLFCVFMCCVMVWRRSCVRCAMAIILLRLCFSRDIGLLVVESYRTRLHVWYASCPMLVYREISGDESWCTSSCVVRTHCTFIVERECISVWR